MNSTIFLESVRKIENNHFYDGDEIIYVDDDLLDFLISNHLLKPSNPLINGIDEGILNHL